MPEAVEATHPVIERICSEVWDLAELSLEEVESAKVHVRELEAAGFTVSTGTARVPTAFVAERRLGDGGPVVGFVSEYDALPGLGNAAVPRREPRADGRTSGHGCGHNMLGAGLTGAAIAVARVLDATGTPGTVRVYGCAAEETEGAKVYMAREGLFEDVDACLHWHAGGDAPNVVPDYARMLLLVRDIDRAHVVATTQWVRQIAEGAALATQTRSEVDVYFGLHDLLPIVMPTAPLGVSMHTWPVAACGGTSIGVKATFNAAQVLARTALDVLTGDELRSAARADFERRTDGFEYVSPIPEGQEGPRGFALPVSAP